MHLSPEYFNLAMPMLEPYETLTGEAFKAGQTHHDWVKV